MKPASISLLIIVLISVIQSCSIESTIHFNKDFSGNYKTVYNGSTILNPEFIGVEDEIENPEEFDMFVLNVFKMMAPQDSISKYVNLFNKNNKLGITNFSYTKSEKDRNAILQFNFKDVNSIQKVANVDYLLNNFEAEGKEFYQPLLAKDYLNATGKVSILNKKRITIELAGFDVKKVTNEDLKDDEETPLKMRYKKKFVFKKRIKNVECNLPYRKDKKSVTVSYSLKELTDIVDNNKHSNIIISLK